jgi:hypothetical protein
VFWGGKSPQERHIKKTIFTIINLKTLHMKTRNKIIGFVMPLLLVATFTTLQLAYGAEGETGPKCKSDHTDSINGFCVLTVEGNSACVVATQSQNCCHSA